MKVSPVQIVLAKSSVENCFFSKENELIFEGLRYDVVSIRQEGNQFIFNAVPDLKETQICAWVSENLQPSSASMEQKMSFSMLDYLPNPQILSLLVQKPSADRSIFFEAKAEKLAGFEWVYAPPPDFKRLIKGLCG